MDQRANPVGLLMRRLPRTALTILKTPWIWAGLLFAGVAVQFSYHPWAVGNTTDLLSLANSLDFKGIVIDGFTAAVRYRPLLLVAVDLLHGIVGANLNVFKAITIVQFAGILWCLVALCRVSTGYQALAACLALSCFVGLHTSRILFGFFPLNHHSLVLLSLLAIAVLGMRARRSWNPVCYFAVCLALPLAIETGLLLPPMLVSLWWAGAPGVQRRDVAWGLGGAMLYVVVRTTFSSAGADVPWIHDGSGLGFGQIEPDGFSDAFGEAPYLFWVYNVMASLMTVLFSEPRGGTFEFIHSLIEGNTPPWRWIQLATSVVTTCTGIVVLMRPRLEGHHRQLLVLGCILILSSSLLGFLYTRDRVVVVAGAGYALLVFLMASLLVESGKYRRAGSVALVVVLLAGWTWRSAESMLVVRDRAFESYSAWVQRVPLQPSNTADSSLFATMHVASIISPPPDPHCAPRWTRRYFERHLGSLITNCANADDYGFEGFPVIHVRWVDSLGNTQRTALERSLGLYAAEHHEGATWRYQVPDTSPQRFDTIVAHGMVADTYGFDRAADARFGPVIRVRWVETLEDTERTALERSLGLYRAEHSEGSTWRYQMPDASPQRLRTIVTHAMVADTNGFDRGTLELDAPGGNVARLAAQPPVYTSGWHPPESDPTTPESTWRWTQQTAALSFANPGADAVLYLDYAGRPDVFADVPQTVTVSAGDQVLQSFVADAAGWRLRRIPLSQAVLGTDDTVEIQIAVDRTFVPASLPTGGRDRRDLGIQVYHAFVVLR